MIRMCFGDDTMPEIPTRRDDSSDICGQLGVKDLEYCRLEALTGHSPQIFALQQGSPEVPSDDRS